MNFLNYIDGKKTYIVVILAIAVIVLNYFEVIDVALYNQLLVLLGVGAVASTRSALKK